MFNTNQLSTLENKLAQVLSNSAFINTSKAPKPLSVNQTFNVNGRTVTSLTSCSKNDDILIVQDSITKKYYCVAGQSSSVPNRELSRNVVLSRQTRPRERLMGNPTCEILKLAFLYRIINNDKSQDIWLSDFNGKQHFIKTIPAALDYGDMTYTIEITYPAYTWKRYDITYEYKRVLSSTTYNVTDAKLWDMSIAIDSLPNYDADVTGVYSGGISYIKKDYACDHPFGAPPPSPYYGTVSFNAAYLAIPKYILGEDYPAGFVPNPSRPSTSVFVAADSEDDNYPFEIEWADLDDTSGIYPAIFDANGALLASEVPYYFSSSDSDYWGVSLSNQTLSNPGGIGYDGETTRFMTAVSTFRYREFDGSVSFHIDANEVRPYPVNKIAETEFYLTYDEGKLRFLIRDTGRPDGKSPGLNCQPGDPYGDYFINISKYELSDAGDELVTPESLPSWMSALDSPDRVSDILSAIGVTGTDVYDFINYQVILEEVNRKWRDFAVNEDGFIPIKNPNLDPPELESVYGWIFELPNGGSVENSVLSQEVISFEYYIEPIQVDLNLNLSYDSVGFGGGSGESDALPILGSTNVNQVKVNFTPPEIEGITKDNFEVLDTTINWSSNTFEYCFDLTQIVPIQLGGS
jgi:hypothetical protein